MKEKIQFHFGSRGVRRGLLFEKPEHYQMMYDIFDTLSRELEVFAIEYCLIPNHTHFEAEMYAEVKTEFLQRLNWNFARKYNLDTRQSGHVFDERVWSFTRTGNIVVPRIMAYITHNPEEAGLANGPLEWEHCGYKATLGLRKPFPWHKPELGLKCLSPNLDEARVHYRKLVESYSQWLASLKQVDRRWLEDHPATSARAANALPDLRYAALTDFTIRQALAAGALRPSFGMDAMDLRLLGMVWFAGASERQMAVIWKTDRDSVHWRSQQARKRLERIPGAREELMGQLRRALLWVPD